MKKIFSSPNLIIILVITLFLAACRSSRSDAELLLGSWETNSQARFSGFTFTAVNSDDPNDQNFYWASYEYD